MQTQGFVCKLLDRSYGAVWTTTSPPSGPLSVRMLFTDENGEETWVVPVNDIPENWKPGDIYDSGVQVIAWYKNTQLFPNTELLYLSFSVVHLNIIPLHFFVNWFYLCFPEVGSVLSC